MVEYAQTNLKLQPAFSKYLYSNSVLSDIKYIFELKIKVDSKKKKNKKT